MRIKSRHLLATHKCSRSHLNVTPSAYSHIILCAVCSHFSLEGQKLYWILLLGKVNMSIQCLKNMQTLKIAKVQSLEISGFLCQKFRNTTLPQTLKHTGVKKTQSLLITPNFPVVNSWQQLSVGPKVFIWVFLSHREIKTLFRSNPWA